MSPGPLLYLRRAAVRHATHQSVQLGEVLTVGPQLKPDPSVCSAQDRPHSRIPRFRGQACTTTASVSAWSKRQTLRYCSLPGTQRGRCARHRHGQQSWRNASCGVGKCVPRLGIATGWSKTAQQRRRTASRAGRLGTAPPTAHALSTHRHPEADSMPKRRYQLRQQLRRCTRQLSWEAFCCCRMRRDAVPQHRRTPNRAATRGR